MRNLINQIARIAVNTYKKAYNAVKIDDETAREIGERYLGGQSKY